MSEIDIDLQDGEPVDVVIKTTETRTRWKLRDISIDPESRSITVRFYSAINGKVIHKTRSLSVEQDPETGIESGFWLDNLAKLKTFYKQILDALHITEIQ